MALLLVSACGLELRGADSSGIPSPVDGGASLEAAAPPREASAGPAVDAAAALDDAGLIDTGVSVADAGGAAETGTSDASTSSCTPLTDNDFSNLGNWAISQTTPLPISAMSVQLTNETLNQRGAVFWKGASRVVPPKALEMTLVFSSSTLTAPKRGNGFGLVFANSLAEAPTIRTALAPTGVGACSVELGVSAGYALVLATAQSPTAKPSLRVINVNDCATTPILGPIEVSSSILDGMSHTLRLTIERPAAQSLITVTIDNGTVWSRLPAEIALAGSLYFGATAATGNDPHADNHFVQSLAATLCY
jgi:hypothetical protein